MKHFLSINDLSPKTIKETVTEAVELKKRPIGTEPPFVNQSMVMIFDKPSLRTRLSFEVGMTQLGGHAVYLAPGDIKLGVRESVQDTAKVVSSMGDIIVARVSSHSDITELAKHSSVPVVNAMTDREHPCQVLADLQTVYEHFGTFDGLKIAYLGDANNNVTNSWALLAESLGLELRIAAPPGYELSDEFRKLAPSVQCGSDPAAAVKDAHVIITDTWVSMGKEAEAADRLKALAPYQVNQKLMDLAAKNAVFLHCLPAYRGKEVTPDVIDGPQSLVFQEAENRLHAQKAVILRLLN